MMDRTILRLIASGLLLAAFSSRLLAAQAQDEPLTDRAVQGSEVSTAERSEYAYGLDALQKLDFWPAAAGARPAPLVLFVHGGGWKLGDKRSATGMQKVEHFTREGFAFASMNYRLVPDATVEQQAADVAAAVAWLRGHAARLGIDASRIVLMGHSAGAHLAALVGTDPQYLAAAGLSLSDLRGVVALDGACYDIPRQLASAGRFIRGTYVQAFGTEPARQRALSPALQNLKPGTPPFLIAHVDRADGKAQSEVLAKALSQAGIPAEVIDAEGTGLIGHLEINRLLGRADYPATAVVDAWLRKLLRST
ncbi:alpha/beta hydrolase [Variovorax ureilyticus]|uniref:Alpha/beta hydrolase n=1 Tax=Variovorax ureilyticus TaxID=1836198 RepID=A0ABU8VGU0_9BURK